jgi:hypothetical protein
MDYTVNHLWPYIHAEEADHEDAETIPQNGEWNDKDDKHEAPPRGLQE